jgi:predicted ArsR family transcriptional regulator
MASLKARAALANLCLLRLRQRGGRATTREVAADIGKPVEMLQPRFNDLLREGRVRDTGERVSSGRGRPQVVWEEALMDPGESTDTVPAGRDPEQPSWFSKYGQ